MCSAIAGDRKRGVGILNNELYIGVRVWNRSRRVKADEGRDAVERRQEADHVRAEVPELRIIDDALWRRVKDRQQLQANRIGARVAEGIEASKAQRTGRRSQYLFTGMLKCTNCGANFVVAGASQSYVCATRAFGGLSACSNSERVPRLELESALMEALQAKLLGPEYMDLFASEVRKIMADEAKGSETEADTRRQARSAQC
jgi:hypothetical protein